MSIHRWCKSSAGRWWKPVSHLHGRYHRLRAAGVRSHGNLHQMWKEDERVPHLQAVRSAGSARLQVLKLWPEPWIYHWGWTAVHDVSQGLMLQQAWATSRSLKPDCCLLAYHGLSPPSLTNSCSSPSFPGGPSSAAPGHSLVLSLVCYTHSRTPCHHFLLSILCCVSV